MQSENPYAPPSVVGSIPPFAPRREPLLPASTGLRFANFFLDNLVTTGISWGTGLVLGIGYALSRANPTVPIQPNEETTLNIIGFIASLGTTILYFIITESLFQRSLGKFVTGTRVVSADGGVPTFGQIVGRTFARFIPFEAFSFLGGNGFPEGWHDSLSGTRVVKM